MRNRYLRSFVDFFSANFIVRILGLLKDLMFAWIIGPTKVLDIFFFLTSFPILMNNTWNRALETVLLSNYEKVYSENGKENSNKELSLLLYNFTIISFLFYIFSSIILPVVIYTFYPDFNIDDLILIVFIINLIFVIETYLLGIKVFCHSQHRFFIPAILPVFQSVFIIIGLILTNKISLLFLSTLLTIGTLAQFLFFFKSEFRFIVQQIFKRIQLKIINPYIKNISQLALASGLSNLNLIIDQIFALAIGEGANTYIHYGNFFLLVFTVLIVNNISTIFFPQFQKYVIDNNHSQLAYDAQKVTRIILLLNLFVMTFILNNGYFFLSIILGNGKIEMVDIEYIYYCTLGYGGAFIGLALNAILVRVLHVYNRYKIIVQVAIINIGVNIVLNYYLTRLFGIWGIALSTSITLNILITIYIIYLKRSLNINIFKSINFVWIKKYIGVTSLVILFEIIIIHYLDIFKNISTSKNIYIFISTFIVISFLIYLFKLVQIKDKRVVI